MVDTMPYTPTGANFSASIGFDTIIYKPEFGRSRSRRRGIGQPDSMNISWVLSKPDYDGFITFFKTTLAGGSLPFYLSIAGATRTLRFTDAPSVDRVEGVVFYVSGVFEVIA
jgi:hypothetical protein